MFFFLGAAEYIRNRTQEFSYLLGKPVHKFLEQLFPQTPPPWSVPSFLRSRSQKYGIHRPVRSCMTLGPVVHSADLENNYYTIIIIIQYNNVS